MKSFNSLGRVLLVACVLLTSACCAPAPRASLPLQIEAQWSGPHGGGDTPETLVLHNIREWQALWERLGREMPRPLDPSRETAVVVFLGERRTGGYAVELVGLRAANDALIVEYRERTPPPDSMVPQVLTTPWAVGIVPATDSPIRFAQLASPDTPAH